jgi:hypothetical protein
MIDGCDVRIILDCPDRSNSSNANGLEAGVLEFATSGDDRAFLGVTCEKLRIG